MDARTESRHQLFRDLPLNREPPQPADPERSSSPQPIQPEPQPTQPPRLAFPGVRWGISALLLAGRFECVISDAALSDMLTERNITIQPAKLRDFARQWAVASGNQPTIVRGPKGAWLTEAAAAGALSVRGGVDAIVAQRALAGEFARARAIVSGIMEELAGAAGVAAEKATEENAAKPVAKVAPQPAMEPIVQSEQERAQILAALQATTPPWHRGQAAQALRMSRRTFQRRLLDLGIIRGRPRGSK